MPHATRVTVLALSAAVLLAVTAAPRAAADPPPAQWFLDLMTLDEAAASDTMARIAERWQDGYAPILIDLARFTRADEEARSVDVSDVLPPADPQGLTHAPRRTGAEFRSIGGRRHPTAPIRARLVRFLERQTGQRFGDDLDRWRQWTWRQPYAPHPDYLALKAELSRGVDPRLRAFLSPLALERVRLDEVEWSGLGVDEVPPLDAPAMVPAGEARYMRDRQMVAGIAGGGEARAYPLRLLGWHHAVHDRIDGRDILVTHCPMSGVVAAFELGEGGAPSRFGTSGLVYRSGSLLYDRETASLWSMLTGRPLIGRLAESPVVLLPVPVVLASWRDWRAQHPASTVLSLETGHAFRYAEGAMTRRRLAEAGLVFPAPDVRDDLRGDDEVLGLRPSDAGGTAVAIATGVLARRGVHDLAVAGRRFVVTTDRDGGARVYDAPDTRIVSRSGACAADTAGRCWRASEDALTLHDNPALRANRLPAVRAFWLAWAAEYPDTLVIR